MTTGKVPMSKMTEEEKQAQLQAEAEQAEKEKADAEAKALADAEAAKQNLETVDYEALAKAEKERREAAERLLAEDRYNASRQKRETEDERLAREALEADDDKPITAKELPAILARERQATQKDLQETRALDIARANTSSESEAQAAVVFWKNRVVPTGNIEEDIKFAIGGLNSKKIVAKNTELARALRAKDTITDNAMGEHRDGLPNEAPKLADNSPLKGYEWKGGNTYTKKLSNGKTLFRNAKPLPGEPKTWVV